MTEPVGGHSRPIAMPKNKKEGLENFLQMIINWGEAGNIREAVLATVDLLEDVRSGIYDDALKDATGFSQIVQQAQKNHAAALVAQAEISFAAGQQAERERIAKILGIAP